MVSRIITGYDRRAVAVIEVLPNHHTDVCLWFSALWMVILTLLSGKALCFLLDFCSIWDVEYLSSLLPIFFYSSSSFRHHLVRFLLYFSFYFLFVSDYIIPTLECTILFGFFPMFYRNRTREGKLFEIHSASVQSEISMFCPVVSLLLLIRR